MARPAARRLLLSVLLALLAAAPAGATVVGYRSACALDLSSLAAGSAGGPVCGTDEGDDVGWSGEDTPLRFYGENGHDTVDGSRYGDVLAGGPGNDDLSGGRGDDLLDGGDDSDTLLGGLGDDFLRERRFGVRERLYGGPGDDVVAGGRGSDALYGGPGDDTLVGGSGSDRLYGGPGDDVLYGGPNRDTFDCGPGDDVVYRRRRSGDRRLSTERADASIPRSAGCERIVDVDPTDRFPLRQLAGGSGPDGIAGGAGDDFIEGKGGPDRLFGGGGTDEIEGDGASGQAGDLIMGGSGDDRLAGRSGDDRIYGDARSPRAGPPGDDEIVGGSGRDLLVGGPGADLIVGAYDGDTIRAGDGDDVVTLLGGDSSDPGGRVEVDCGHGFDVVVVNPDRRGRYRGCEAFAQQFHEVDFGRLARPSREIWPTGVPDGVAAASLLPRPAFPARPRAPRRARRPTGAASADPQGGASSPSISADGSRVSFNSDAANLVPADANTERTDPFVRDLELGATVLADARRSGRSPQRGARFRLGPGESLSADGRYAVFSSNTPDLAGRVRHYAIFRRDLSRRVTQRACRAGDGDSFNPVIAADGRHVAFESEAAHLAGSDQNQQIDVYWCDVATGELRRVSQPLVDGVSSSGTSTQPSISADGRYVAFASDAGGLAPGDEGRAGVYWRDMVTGETRVVDVPPGGSTSNGNGEHPRISADGRFVVFDSDATDLPGGELDGRTVDVFRKDMATGEVTLVSSAPGGANGDSTADSLSADGNLVAFTSSASNLVSGDSNGRADVFVRDVAAGTTTLVSRGPGGAPLPGPSSQGAISADGRFVAFASRAAGVFPQDTPTQRPRVYRRDLWTGELLPVTVGLDLAPTSVIGEPSGVSLRRKVRLIAGTAKDDGLVTRVDVAASRSVGRGRCLWLGRRGATVRRSCGRPLWLRAKVASGLRWTLRIGRLLPRGTWTVRSRATDDTGRVEKPRPGRNVTSFRLR